MRSMTPEMCVKASMKSRYRSARFAWKLSVAPRASFLAASSSSMASLSLSRMASYWSRALRLGAHDMSCSVRVSRSLRHSASILSNSGGRIVAVYCRLSALKSRCEVPTSVSSSTSMASPPPSTGSFTFSTWQRASTSRTCARVSSSTPSSAPCCRLSLAPSAFCPLVAFFSSLISASTSSACARSACASLVMPPSSSSMTPSASLAACSCLRSSPRSFLSSLMECCSLSTGAFVSRRCSYSSWFCREAICVENCMRCSALSWATRRLVSSYSRILDTPTRLEKSLKILSETPFIFPCSASTSFWRAARAAQTLASSGAPFFFSAVMDLNSPSRRATLSLVTCRSAPTSSTFFSRPSMFTAVSCSARAASRAVPTACSSRWISTRSSLSFATACSSQREDLASI
mmetsp:Transcript_38602/g.122645  ORF Transcript_38602/g.122645 Transcript_38602/m.122645 type:complete len:404 (+) Transcript_38602:512-1723(+)